MALLNKGSVTANIFKQDASTDMTSETKLAYLLRFKYIAGGPDAYYLRNEAQNMGYFRTVGGTTISANMRTVSDNTLQTLDAAPVDGQIYTAVCTEDLIAGEGLFFLGGVQVGSALALTGATFKSASIRATLEGPAQDGIDPEEIEAAFWVGTIPTPADIAAYESGTALDDLPNPPTYRYAPVGDGTTYISTLTDEVGTNDMTHTQGPTTGGNEPVADGAVSGPTITDVDGDETITNGQSGVVITGTAFEVLQVTGDVDIGGVDQDETAWSDGSVTFNHVLGTRKFGDDTLTVINDSGESGSLAIVVVPEDGSDYIDLTSVSGSDISAAPALAIGDQLQYEITTTPTGRAVSISAGGVISITGDPAGESFDVRVNDGTGWGAWAEQSATSNETNFSPVHELTIPNKAGVVGDSVNVDLSSSFSDPNLDALTYSITQGALPFGLLLDVNTGAISGTLDAVGLEAGIVVSATDGEFSTDSNAFSWTVNVFVPESGAIADVLVQENGQTPYTDSDVTYLVIQSGEVKASGSFTPDSNGGFALLGANILSGEEYIVVMSGVGNNTLKVYKLQAS